MAIQMSAKCGCFAFNSHSEPDDERLSDHECRYAEAVRLLRLLVNGADWHDVQIDAEAFLDSLDTPNEAQKGLK